MKIINILFNHKKSSHDNQVLGVERCFLDYSKRFILKGEEVFSVMKTDMVYKEEMQKTGSGILELNAFGKADILSTLRLAWLFFKFDADIIICHSGRAVSFARMARSILGKKTPIVAIDHGINPKKFLKADYVLTVNSFFSKELVKAGMPQDRAFVIPNMIDPPKDFIAPVKEKFRNPLRVGSLGRLYPEKYFDKMVRALAVLRDRGIECEYVIGGVGPMEESLNSLAKDIGVEKNFKILGWTKDKKEFFNSIDIFILPSWGETFGIVLLEAMLYNTPIITTNSWGPDEVITEGVTGLKVSKDDAEKMPELIADAIERLIKDQELAKELAKNAHEKFFAEYSSDKVIEKLNNTIKTIIEKEKKA